LIEGGAHVVGRTRFCVHPKQELKNITAVGGTKDLKLEVLRSLKPDLLILDREENLQWMKDQSPCEVLVAHITSIADMVDFSKVLCQKIPGFKDFSKRWQRVLSADPAVWNWMDIPGADSQWGHPASQPRELFYVIWKDPWMRVAQETFISDVLKKLGAGAFLVQGLSKYPEFAESEFRDPYRLFLFSSEPYPFMKAARELQKITPTGALVDGESYSWFGIRSLRFLESRLDLESP
jgi:hypothetical protein